MVTSLCVVRYNEPTMRNIIEEKSTPKDMEQTKALLAEHNKINLTLNDVVSCLL